MLNCPSERSGDRHPQRHNQEDDEPQEPSRKVSQDTCGGRAHTPPVASKDDIPGSEGYSNEKRRYRDSGFNRQQFWSRPDWSTGVRRQVAKTSR